MLELMRFCYPATAIGLWAVLLAPSLCIGGWLDHPCKRLTACTGHSGAEQGCPPHDEHTDDESHDHSEPCDHSERGTGECNHEENCFADPCAQLVWSGSKETTLLTAELLPDLRIASVEDSASRTPVMDHLHFGTPPPNAHHTRGRPYADRAIPLLI